MSIGIKTIKIFIVLFSISLFCYAQETPEDVAEKQIMEVIPLLTITGRIVTKGKNISLITADAKGYLLEKKDGFQEAFNQVTELAGKDADVSLSGFDTGKIKTFSFLDHKTKQAKKQEYKVLSVAIIHSVTEGSVVSDIDISKTIEYDATVKEMTLPALRQISGTISKCNFKNVIPTIELKEKEGFALIITPNTQALKVIGDSLASFKPVDVLTVGKKVQVWYEEYGYQNTARTILIMEENF